MRFNTKNLDESQLIALYQMKRYLEKREEIEREWIRRYAVPYPYTLDIRGNIINAETYKVIEDNLAPEEVYLAAEKARERRAQRRELNG